MIISDGTTDLTFKYANEKNRPAVDKTTRTSASGALKSQTTGERMALIVSFHCTAAEYRALLTLLTNGATTYYYTPEEDYSNLYPSLVTPFEANISKTKVVWDVSEHYEISLLVEKVDYE